MINEQALKTQHAANRPGSERGGREPYTQRVAYLSTRPIGPSKRNWWLASSQLTWTTARSRIGIVFWRGEGGAFNEGDTVRRGRFWMLER